MDALYQRTPQGRLKKLELEALIKKAIRGSRALNKARSYDQKYLKATVKALRLYEPDRARELMRKFLSRSSRFDFSAINPHSKEVFLGAVFEVAYRMAYEQSGTSWRRLLCSDVADGEASRYAVAFVTIVDKAWCCSADNIRFDLRVAKRRVRNALSGFSFIARFEPVIFRNQYVDDGQMVVFHVHAIVCCTSMSTWHRKQRQIRKRFSPPSNVQGKSVHSSEVLNKNEFESVAAYIAKMAHDGTRTYRKSNGKQGKKKCPISAQSQLKLLKAMSKFTTFDLWLASGEGAKLLQDAKRLAKAGSAKDGLSNRRRPRAVEGLPKLVVSIPK